MTARAVRRRGEIVGVAGVEGNGQAELEEVLFGLRQTAEGRVLLDGGDVTDQAPAGRLARGVGIVPSDRYRRGLVGRSRSPTTCCSTGSTSPRSPATAPPAPSDPRACRRAGRAVRDSRVAAQSACGNAFGRERAARRARADPQPRAPAPDRGAAYPRSRRRRDGVGLGTARGGPGRGLAVLLISTDLDEVMALADRCLVLYGGRVIAEWPRANSTARRSDWRWAAHPPAPAAARARLRARSRDRWRE